MSNEGEDCKCPPCPVGAPLWMTTFADLMSLLMSFFVLLLAFSEMDVQKFKQLAGSMRKAFGVQRELTAHEIPKGTSIVKREFSPAKPEPTVLNVIRQKTIDRNQNTLSAEQGLTQNFKADLAENKQGVEDADTQNTNKQTQVQQSEQLIEAGADQQNVEDTADNQAQVEEDARTIAEALAGAVRDGQLEIETASGRIIIRILSDVSFESGANEMNKHLVPVLGKLRQVLGQIEGDIIVEGHTDNVPIENARYRSNWDLATARALAVAHVLLLNEELRSERFVVTGYADTRPRAPNDNPLGRSKNRRVEIIIERSNRSFNRQKSRIQRSKETTDLLIFNPPGSQRVLPLKPSDRKTNEDIPPKSVILPWLP
ncbi:MAG: flagellar motor protein MotB [Gammaproteobacteria bacterium]